MRDESSLRDDLDPIEKAIWAFEKEWANARVAGLPGPDPAVFWTTAPVASRRRELAIGLASVDMENRLMLGEPARVEEYVDSVLGAEFEFGELGELIRAEYIGRLFQGDDPPCDSYRQRFPGVCDQELLADLCRLRADPTHDPHVPRYRIISPHRRGGIGWIYLAYDRELRRRVALKEIVDADDSLAAERTRREAQIAAQLDHRGIVTIHSSSQWSDGRPYYVMRFVAGRTLAQEIERLHEGRLTAGLRHSELRMLLTRFTAACHAVEHAHDHKIVHLDLKPNNILLGPYAETVVIDWGSSRRLDQSVDAANSTGTPAYMSPEQADNDLDRLNAKTDIFNLGASLYHILTGRAPFQPPSSGQLENAARCAPGEIESRGAEDARERASAGALIIPHQLVRNIPKALEAVCLKAMAREQGKRYASALELVQDLEYWLDGDPVSAWREPTWVRAWRWAVQHPTLISTSASAILVTLVLSGIGAFARQRQVDQESAAVEVALARAEQLRFDAKAAWASRLDRTAWPSAEEAASAAAKRASLRVPVSLRRKASQMAELVAAEAKAAKDSEALIGDLAAVRAAKGEQYDISSEFRRAFEEHGLPVTAANSAAMVEMLTTRLRGQPGLVGVNLASYLDEWAFQLLIRKESPGLTTREREDNPRLAERLTTLARSIDPDRWRGALRDTLSHPSLQEWRRTLSRLSEAPDTARQPAQSLTLMALALLAAREPAEVISLLESARFRHHDDPLIYQYLGIALRTVRPPRTEDALRAFSAATALRPEMGYEMATALSETGRTAEAITVLADVVRRHPEAWYFNKLGEMQASLGLRAESDASYARAETLSRRRLASRHDDALAQFYLGNVLIHLRDWLGAISAFQEAIKLKPNYAEAYCGQSIALRNSGNLQDAIAACREAIRLKPDSIDAHNILGIALSAVKDLTGAIKENRVTIGLNPEYATGYYNLGINLAESKDYRGAIVAYREAIRLKPDYALAYIGLGRSLRDSAELKGAIAAYREAIRLRPDYALAHSGFGFALRMSGDLSGSIAASRKAIGLDPNLPDAYSNLGAALHASKDITGAIAAFRKWTLLKPDDAEAQCNLGTALYDSRKFPDAIAAYHKAISLNSKNPLAYNGLGFSLAASKDLTGAVDAFRNVIQLNPDDAEAFANLGNVLDASGDLPNAIVSSRRAIWLNPNHARAHCVLGHSLLKLGLCQEALAALERGDALGARQLGWNVPSADWLEETRRRLAVLEARLPSVVAGSNLPRDTGERAELAAAAFTKGIYPTAARLYAKAFAELPVLADSPATGRRYNAALSAVMASVGTVKDETPSDDASRTAFRKQAFAWLQADFASWTKILDGGPPELREAIAPTLREWKKEAKLAGVRDDVHLAYLPDNEREAWRRFWSEVDFLLLDLSFPADPFVN